MLDNYLNYLQEGYILSDKTISVNLNEFENRIEDKLLIVGTSGSGKTTLGEYLADKYNVKWISIDSLYFRLRKKHFPDRSYSEELKSEVEKKVKEETINALKSNKRRIIEGIDLIEIYEKQPQYRNLIINNAFIVLGIPSLKAGIRAGMRNLKRRGGEGWRELYWMTKYNIKKIEPGLKLLRKDLIRKYGNKIEEYKVPNL